MQETQLLSTDTVFDGNFMIFVVYGGRAAIGLQELTHDQLALTTGVFNSDKIGDKPWVDDGGTIDTFGDSLFIMSTFSDRTRIGPLFENETEEQQVVEKKVRQKTGQLIADLSGKQVRVQHRNGDKEDFFPKK